MIEALIFSYIAAALTTLFGMYFKMNRDTYNEPEYWLCWVVAALWPVAILVVVITFIFGFIHGVLRSI